ncbi:hypothetical protein [Streptomyces sp. NBC_01187]|uniref:hypothetical protein n=1 Tax=Streptomyces sp. NBC_01187 TaxID=2903766 RepID=UPI00386CE55E|nr:hypothetical protein OG220_05615 [Streptomyces sp. NBC_01187]
MSQVVPSVPVVAQQTVSIARLHGEARIACGAVTGTVSGGTVSAQDAYLADESTASTSPPRPAWVGRVQMPLDGDRARMVTARGAEWTARTADLRPATDVERTAYDAERRPSPGARW